MRTARPGGWIAYTPTWTAATTNPSLGNGTLGGAYLLEGRTMHIRINFTAGSTSTYGTGAFIFSLPRAVSAGSQILYLRALDTSASQRYVGVGNVGSGGLTPMFLTADGAGSGEAASTVPFTWATNDLIRAQGTLEVD